MAQLQSTGITGSLTVTGAITARELKTEFVSASILYESGSTKFGDTSDDIHSFTGSIVQSEGTTTVGDKLYLTNVASSGADGILAFDSTDTAAGSRIFSFTRGSGNALKYHSYGYHLWQSGGVNGTADSTNRMILDSSGRLGIGTTSPGEKLTVDGNVLVSNLYLGGNSFTRLSSDGSGEVGINYNNSATTTYGFSVYNGATSRVFGVKRATGDVDISGNVDIGGDLSMNGGTFLTDDGVSHYVMAQSNLYLYSGASATMTLEAGGNVGIGTTSPSYKLEVKGTSSNIGDGDQIFSVGNTSGGTQLAIGSSENSYNWIRSYESGIGGRDLVLATDAERMRITSAGNVGIGTSSPDVLLHLYRGTSTPSSNTGTTLMKIENYVGSDLQQQKSFVDFVFKDGNGNETPQVRIGAEVGENGNADTQAKEGSGAFVVYTNDADTDSGDAGTSLAERFRVDYAGNVGVGTTSPSNILHTYVNNTDTSIPGILVEQAGTGDSSIGFLLSGVRTWSVGVDNSDSDKFIIGSGEDLGTSARIVVDTSGNVGIGTTSPSSKLEIRSESADHRLVSINRPASTTAALYLGNDSASPANAVISSNYSDLILGRDQSGVLTEHLRIKRDGNVGIGTTSPTSKLHVSGTSDVFLVEGSGSSSNTTIMAIDGNNGRLFEISDDLSDSLFSVNTVAGLPVMEAFADNTVVLGAYNQNDLVVSGSKVGIGTASPGAKLEIFSSSDNQLRLDASGTYSAMYLTQNQTPKAAIWINHGTLGMFVGTTVSNGYLAFGTDSSSEKVRITAAGNVGIGTTSPEANLHVNAAGGGILRLSDTSASVAGDRIGAIQTATSAGTFFAGINFYYHDSSNGEIRIRQKVAGTNTDTVTFVDGNVGIGTASPSYRLDVAGDARFYDSSVAGSGILIDTGAANLVKLRAGYPGDWAATSIQIQSSTTSGLDTGIYLESGGNVGIGTTSPDRNLHVYQGDSGVTGYALTGGIDIESTSISGINILSPNAGYGRIYFGAPISNTAGAIEYIHNATLASGYMKLRAGGSDRVFILGNGNVGIGTTSPASKLQVNVGTNQNVAINSTGGVARISAYDDAFANSVPLIINGSDLRFTNNTSEAVRITGGNVGIGTTSPSAQLHVSSASTSATSIYVGNTGTGVSRAYFDASNGDFSGGDYMWIGQNNDLSGEIVMTQLAGAFHIKTQPGGTITSRLTVLQDGNVGIGTTSPAAQLQIDTPASNSAGQGLRLNRPSAGTHYHSVEFATDGTVDWSVGQNLNDAFEVYENGTAATTRLTIKEGGNVGIGTTSPSFKLHVLGTSGGDSTFTSGILIDNNNATDGEPTLAFRVNSMVAGGNYWLTGLNQSADYRIAYGTSFTGPNTLFSIQADGNVGIGTTAPDQKLHIVGGDSDGIRVSGGTNNRFVDITGTSLDFYTTSISGWAMGNIVRKNSDGSVLGYISGGFGDPNTLTYTFYGGTVYSNAAMYILSSNNYVGIGTSSPGAKLHVSGGAQYITASANATAFLRLYSNAQSSSQFEIGQGFATTTDNVAYLWNAANASLVLGTNSTERMRITSDGNVGIGTTSPSTKLHVVGDLTVTGDSNISTLENSGTITTADWDTLFTSPKLRVLSIHGMTAGANNAPPLSYTYGAALTYNRTTNEGFQLYLPENAANSTSGDRRIAYRTAWNGTWSSWRRFVDMIGNVGYVTGGNNTGFEVHSDVSYNQDPGTYLLLRGQADNNQPYALKVLVTGNASGNDIEWRRLKFNGADERMYYAPEGANQIIFDYTFVQGSDERKKDNIALISDPIQKIKQLRGAEFDWNQGVHEGTHDVGVIAQDVEAVLPEAVTTQQDGYKNVAYNKIIPLLIEGMKEQQAMIEQLTARIQALENK